MDEQNRPEGIEPDGDVEAHGVKDVATVGLSAAALLAASGTAAAATDAGHPASSHAAAHVAKKADPTMKIVDKKPDATIKFGDITLKRGVDHN